VELAQGKLDRSSALAMQAAESTLLDTALALELIDATQKIQLERLREDRNLCAHPSLRRCCVTRTRCCVGSCAADRGGITPTGSGLWRCRGR
jgi:hypothetical protein